MKKLFIKSLVIALITISIFTLTACNLGSDKTPDESTLIEAGHSLNKSIDSLKELKDNYKYTQEIHQTNGEDWFDYSLVKLNDGDIFLRDTFINNNTGWEHKEEALTDYSDLSDKSYTISKKSGNDYIEYRKFEASDNENFEKYYYEKTEAFDTNARAKNYLYDFSFLNADNFYYFETTNDEGISAPYWKTTASILSDDTFKETVYKAMNINISSDINTTRIDYFDIYVTDNIVNKVCFHYWGGYNMQYSYHYTIEFDYDNYNFNVADLTQGFTKYIQS
ncbi:MAG: hypothetical protein WCR54_02430 [Clostridia bacterium]